MSFIKQWFQSRGRRQGLDSLLGEVPAPGRDLRERLIWIEQLVHWVRSVGPSAADLKLPAHRIEGARLKFALQVLERNVGLKMKVAETLRSLIRETRALELFMNAGIPNQEGFIGEFLERLGLKLLPQAPLDHDLVFVFSETFRFESDAEWIRQVEPAVFQGWLELFHFSDGAPVAPWNSLIPDARDALFLLSQSVGAAGLSRNIRNRVSEGDFRLLPFFDLPQCVEAILTVPTALERAAAYQALYANLKRCSAQVDEVYSHFRNRGVNISLVYQVERLKAQLKRCGTLARLLEGNPQDPAFCQEFFGLLVQENIRARKIGKLFKDNFVLACQMIVETNAETGEHYITRDRREYTEIIKKAGGGGVLTGFTTMIKFGLAHLATPPFISGLLAFGNYAVSFLTLQALGFTLATKQPAMTATVLAAKIDESQHSGALIEEVVHLIRSQLAAVVGNLSTVIPTVMLIDFLLSLRGTHLTNAEHARHTLESFSLLGPTPFYAAWTGVLLWLSSLFAGWFGNWFNFCRMPDAIEHHSRLRYVFGVARTQRFAKFLENNIAGIAASLSLAFLLGMTPQFSAFFGFFLDVRHVTLSSGALAASIMALGPSVFSTWYFWLAVGGILSMAVLNLGVSFFLALTVALWAKKANAPKRSVIYRALFRKALRQPWLFFIPSRDG